MEDDDSLSPLDSLRKRHRDEQKALQAEIQALKKTLNKNDKKRKSYIPNLSLVFTVIDFVSVSRSFLFIFIRRYSLSYILPRLIWINIDYSEMQGVEPFYSSDSKSCNKSNKVGPVT